MLVRFQPVSPNIIMKDLIGVFDSGIGGLSTLEALKKELPNENFFYFGDKKNNPYGEKPQSDLEAIVSGICSFLVKKKSAKMIVVACNTATTKCISFLRDKFPEVKFIGTEPAVKLACDSEAKNILVLATPGTINSERMGVLVEENRKIGQEITLLPCAGLADVIEKNDPRDIEKKLDEIFDNVETEKFDAVVLGCTHYVLVKNLIANYFKNAKILDGNEKTAKHAKKVLQENNLLSEKSKVGTIEYFYT